MLAVRRVFLHLVLTIICGAQSMARADAPKPVLISQPDSTRAIALEATTFTKEPFSLTPLSRFHDLDPRTRILLFALNFSLQPGEDLTAVTADAEDIAHRHYSLKVEFIRDVPGEVWMKQVTLRLNDDFIDPGDVLIGITYRGMASNRVRVGIGHVGGGPPDDNGAGPTPAPPYNISGQIKLGELGLAGVAVRLSGAQAGTFATDNSGSYSFTVNAVGDYAVTPSKTYYNFAPLAQVFDNLSTNQSNINFTAARQTYSISGQFRDENDQGIGGVNVMLQDENALLLKTTGARSNGEFEFAGVPAGYSYVVAPVNNKFFNFISQATGIFTTNLSLAFKGAQRKYTISGRILDEHGKPLGGVPITLSGAQTGNATTDITGNFSFTSLPAGKDYTITPSTTPIHTFTGQSVSNLGGDQTLNFVGVLRTYTLSGQVRDDNDQAIAGVEVMLQDENGLLLKTSVTGANGDLQFTGVPAGFSYVVVPVNTRVFNFISQKTGTLTNNLSLAFKGLRRNYTISGRTLDEAGKALGGVPITLSGAQTGNATTDITGNFSFTSLPAGKDYTITPSTTPIHTFTGQSVSNLSGDQTLNFVGALRTYPIGGQVRDDNDQAIANVQVMLQDENGLLSKTTVTGANGDFQYTGVPAGFSYVVTPVNTRVFNFTSQKTGTLTSNLSLAFKGLRRNYTISGRTLDEAGKPLGGVSITLGGSQTGNATTDITGGFSFASLLAGKDYTITPSTTSIHAFTGQSVANLSGDQTLNFVGILRTYTISGQVRDDNDQVIAGVEVILKDENALPLKTTMTGSGGDFEFTGVRASFAYLVTPSSTSLFNFAAQGTGTVTGNLTFGFKGVRRRYTISGRTLDQENNPISGVPIILSGSQTGSATTDSAGNYSFGGLPAGFDYAVTPPTTTTFYTFAGQRVANLINDTTLNFQGVLRTYTIRGRIVDNTGKALLGITVTLSGTSSDVAKTAIDGSFSFSVKAKGNYTITPSIEQGYYAFAPANPIIEKLGDNQFVNFTATLAPIPSPITVLEFDGTPMTVDHGPFWPGHIDLGPFFWEFWAMPGENSDTRYILSDGYGGAHALLFGFIGGSEPGRYNLFGNIWNGNGTTYFNSDTGPAPGEWGHFAVGWDGKNIRTYFDGVPVGKVAFSGPRQTLGPEGGSGRLLIGGSDHQNVVGRIAQVRGYEDTNPRAVAPESAFTPETLFSVDGDFLSYYLRPSSTIADLSRTGHLVVSHPGTLRGVALGFPTNCPTCPVPKFVVDPKAPNFADPSSPGQISAPVASAPPVPEDARVFDSFSRQNSTYILSGIGGLGSTEGGALGPVAWQTSPTIQGRKPFGILNGRAVPLMNNFSVAWVQPATSSALLVQSDRQNATYGSGVDTSVAFRVQDADNFWFAYTHDGGTKLSVGYYQAGIRTDVASYNMPTTWTTLKVSTRPTDGGINIVANLFDIGSLINPTMKDNQGCGIFNNGAGLGLSNRWDNFTITEIQ